MRSRCYGVLALLLFALPVGAQPDALVRVRILETEAPSEVRVEALAGAARIEVDGRQRGGVWAEEPVTIRRAGGEIEVRFGGAAVRGAEVRVVTERMRLRAGRVDREYLGALVARAEGSDLLLVNHSPTEPYVASVVASEFGFDALEGAKAQAVLARTYALRRAGATPHYDLDDHQGSQVFRGVAHATPTSRRAADETAGEVLRYHGQIAEAFYFSSSGGHTADNDMVWPGAPIPYLRGVPDPYDATSPDHQWRTTAPVAAVHAALSRAAGGHVEGIEVVERSRSGRIRTVRLRGARRDRMSGSQLRRAINGALGARTVRSTRFELSVEGDRYVFRGGGYGHGVGMSQFGALGMDRAGRTYREILAHYFQGTEVTGGQAAPPSRPLAAALPVRAAAPPRAPGEQASLHDRFHPDGAARGGTAPRTSPPPSDSRIARWPTGAALRTDRVATRDDRRSSTRRADGLARRSASRTATPPSPAATSPGGASARRAAW